MNIYDIYEEVLSNKRKRFPNKFWANENSKENGILLLRYIVKKNKLTEKEIQDINLNKLTKDFKLTGLYQLYNKKLLCLLKDSFPNIKFVNYYEKEEYKKRRSEITKNFSPEQWNRIKHGIKHNRYSQEYAEKLSKQKQGELNYSAKLKTEQVIEIRKKWSTGNYSTQSLGNLYGVKRQTIADIVYCRTWKHLL